MNSIEDKTLACLVKVTNKLQDELELYCKKPEYCKEWVEAQKVIEENMRCKV